MATIYEEITEQMKAAMRGKDAVALGALRGLKTALQNAQIAKGNVHDELPATEVMNVIRKQIKQREDSIAMFDQAGRADAADKERAEIGVLSAFLPKEMTEAEILPVLRRSVDAFVAAGCDAVVVVCPPERWEATGLAAACFPVPVTRVDGGAERQDSVAAGLDTLPCGTDLVAVHDGARPLITAEGIRRAVRRPRERRGPPPARIPWWTRSSARTNMISPCRRP